MLWQSRHTLTNTIRDGNWQQAVDLGGARTILAIPMLTENELIGSFTVYRQEVRPFTDKQIELVDELRCTSRHRHRERAFAHRAAPRTELLEQQTATSEVLGVISRSKFELLPILQSVVNTPQCDFAALNNQ